MGQFLTKWIYFKVMGWKMEGRFPSLPKYIVAVVPHTSWFDFFIGLMVRSISGESINFVGKKELFGPLTGWFFKALGGAPIDRTGNRGTVDAFAAVFDSQEKFRLAIAPEGTRKKVTQLKTGFYHIAKRLHIPIVPVSFDYGNKRVIIHPLFSPTPDEKGDMETLTSLFKGVRGYSSEKSF